MNRQLMKSYLAKWLQLRWKNLHPEARGSAVEAYMEGYKQGYEQRKLETSWRSIDK